jgi:hypothetical protein
VKVNKGDKVRYSSGTGGKVTGTVVKSTSYHGGLYFWMEVDLGRGPLGFRNIHHVGRPSKDITILRDGDEYRRVSPRGPVEKVEPLSSHGLLEALKRSS